jgi:hypothetical protein
LCYYSPILDRLTQQLGSGSFGTVFVCVKGEQKYAIKRQNFP